MMEELQMVWGWQPALYLFLGGLGAGASVVAGIMTLRNYEKHRKTVSISFWAAAACLIVGLLLLLTELTNPLRGLMLWQSFSQFGSWMTVGAWLLAAAVAVFLVTAFFATDKTYRLIAKDPEKQGSRPTILKVFAALSILLGIGVAAYTGVLLMAAPGVPLWNTPLLPCLFTVSALDTGVALVELVDALVQEDEEASRKARFYLEIAVAVLVATEIAVLGVLAATMFGGGDVNSVNGAAAQATAIASMETLTVGSLAPYFWGLVVVVGLLVPFIAAILGLAAHDKRSMMFGIVGACGALIGGCALRFVVLAAGTHADIITSEVAKLLFY